MIELNTSMKLVPSIYKSKLIYYLGHTVRNKTFQRMKYAVQGKVERKREERTTINPINENNRKKTKFTEPTVFCIVDDREGWRQMI